MRSSRDRLEKGEQEKKHRVNLREQPTWEALENMKRERGPDRYLTQKLGKGGTWHTADAAQVFQGSNKKATVGNTVTALLNLWVTNSLRGRVLNNCLTGVT